MDDAPGALSDADNGGVQPSSEQPRSPIGGLQDVREDEILSDDMPVPVYRDQHSMSPAQFSTGSHNNRDVMPASSTPVNSSQQAPEAIVQLKNIHKTYLLGIEGVPALRGVTLDIYRNEFLVIFGTSGGGKSSLLNIIGTVDKPTKGELTVCDTVINPKTGDDVLSQLRLAKLGFVFQTFNLISSLTACENVELPMTLKGAIGPIQRKSKAVSSLEQVGLSHRVDHFPTQLSGGEQQRVTIARAIANKPDLLLLDEPTGDLDTANSHRVIDMLLQLNSEGMTMVMVTHDMYLKNFADRVVWMRDGKISKVETIPRTSKANAIRDLRAKIQKTNIMGALPSSDPPPNRRENPAQSERVGIPSSWQKTEVRNPLDYKPIQFQIQASQHRTNHNRSPTNNSQPPSANVSVDKQSTKTGSSDTSSRQRTNFDNSMNSPDSGFMSQFTSPTGLVPK